MIYNFKLPGRSGPNVKVDMSFITGKARVWVEGKEIQPESRKVYMVPISKTRRESMRLSPSIFEMGLDVIYKDERIKVSKKISILEYITSYAPIVLGFFASSVYGANIYMSVGIGVLSVFFSLYNMKILQSDRSGLVKLIFNGAVLVLSWFVFRLIAKL